MNRAFCLIVLICISLVGLTSCRRHRTPKQISFVRTKSPCNKNENASGIKRRGVISDTLSFVEFVKGMPLDNIMLQHTGFVVSYNPQNGTPSWVAWELTSEETTGPITRKDYDFIPDPQLESHYQIEKSDYAGTGYDRGHMCPAGDMEWSASAMNDCHYMTNICPQTPKLNQVYWVQLESACRRWANLYGSVYIVCGPIYSNNGYKNIGINHKIRIPDAYFKVVISLRQGTEKGIGFYYRNDESHQTMEGAAMSIDKVEELMGYDFFSKLPDEIEKRIEAQNKLSTWR